MVCTNDSLRSGDGHLGGRCNGLVAAKRSRITAIQWVYRCSYVKLTNRSTNSSNGGRKGYPSLRILTVSSIPVYDSWGEGGEKREERIS